MSNETMNTHQGHWLLSRIGKRVLRPGGKELTLKLLNELDISGEDDVVEFAPGIGYTAVEVLRFAPHSYTGVEMNKEAAHNLKNRIQGARYKIISEDAAHSGLAGSSANKLYGEAMLTMQADHRKAAIVREASRILRKGGLYAIHELCLTPENMPDATKTCIRKNLAQMQKVNARPLTQSEWIQIIEKEGFRVKKVLFSSMKLLEPNRMIDDEGLFQTLKIGFNLVRHPKIRRRVKEMRTLFKKYENHLQAIAVIAEKL